MSNRVKSEGSANRPSIERPRSRSVSLRAAEKVLDQIAALASEEKREWSQMARILWEEAIEARAERKLDEAARR